MALGLMSSRTQLLIPTKDPKRVDYLYTGHQQEILLRLRKEKETLRNMVMIFSIRSSRMGR
uniref:Nicotinamide phosphoribosyltransferase n=1 Tax=Molossus molossus TaxID=27622 RepID=A0A7J8HE48_MOLMO|nr:nicotinamide phosphoribosyltransferase [Molossus molossus]